MESPNSIESIGITSKGTNGLADEISLKSARIFEKAGLTVHLIAPLRNKQFLTLDSLADLARAQIDLVAVVGGDGTILKTARQIKGRIPIVGINVGGRGILAEISPSEVDKATRMIKDRQFQIQKRTRIFARTESESYPPVLNEVYVDKVRRIRTPRFSISTPDLVQNGYELKLRMDGVIVSTPTGSTGHSYSFRSTIVYEELEALLVTPIAPISHAPSIVLPMTEINITSNDDSSLLLDGQIDFKVTADSLIRISKHKVPSLFLRFGTSILGQMKRIGF